MFGCNNMEGCCSSRLNNELNICLHWFNQEVHTFSCAGVKE